MRCVVWVALSLAFSFTVDDTKIFYIHAPLVLTCYHFVRVQVFIFVRAVRALWTVVSPRCAYFLAFFVGSVDKITSYVLECAVCFFDLVFARRLSLLIKKKFLHSK